MKHKITKLIAMVAMLVMICVNNAIASNTNSEILNFLNEQSTLLPAYWQHPKHIIETSDDYKNRKFVINLAADAAADEVDIQSWGWSKESLILAAYAKMYHESGRFHLKVHDGSRRGDNGRSVCLGQIMNGKSELIGTDFDSTKNCAAEVMRHLIIHRNRCLKRIGEKPTAWQISVVYAGYGTGHSCNGNIHRVNVVTQQKEYWARDRASMWSNLMNDYEKLWK